MKLYVIEGSVAFVIGLIILFFPKDVDVPNAYAPSQDKQEVIMANSKCITYKQPYKVGKNLQPVIESECDSIK